MSTTVASGFEKPTVRWAALLGIAALCAGLALISSSVAVSLSLATLISVASFVVGVRRQLVRDSVIDPFAPFCFPLLYVAFSSLYPAWLILHDKVALMGFSPESYGPKAAGLIAASVIGFAIGVHLIAWDSAPRPHADPGWSPEEATRVARILRFVGRGLAALLALVGLANAVLSGPQSRALNQSTYQVSDSMKAAALILALPAVALILVARANLPSSRRASVIDWSLIGALVVSSSLSGGRALAITVMLCAAYCSTRKTRSLRRTLAPFAAIVVFALIVLAYRQRATGAQGSLDPFRSVATDLSPVSYTLGLVHAQVPSKVGYQLGLTYGDALIHQIPSIISGPIMGASDHTGSMMFRHQILHMTNPNAGYGFSVPAEAYLNFGAIGLLVVAVGLGWLLTWAYQRQAWPSLSTRSLVYVCLVAPLPFAYRSDALGAVKGSLYPVLLLALSFWVAHRISRRETPDWVRIITRSGTGASSGSVGSRHDDPHAAYERNSGEGER